MLTSRAALFVSTSFPLPSTTHATEHWQQASLRYTGIADYIEVDNRTHPHTHCRFVCTLSALPEPTRFLSAHGRHRRRLRIYAIPLGVSCVPCV